MSIIEFIRKQLQPPEYYVWADYERRPENQLSITPEEKLALKVWLANAKKVILERFPTTAETNTFNSIRDTEKHIINSLILQMQKGHITTNQIVTVAKNNLRYAVCGLFYEGVDSHPECTDQSIAWLKRFDPDEAAKFVETLIQLKNER